MDQEVGDNGADGWNAMDGRADGAGSDNVDKETVQSHLLLQSLLLIVCCCNLLQSINIVPCNQSIQWNRYRDGYSSTDIAAIEHCSWRLQHL